MKKRNLVLAVFATIATPLTFAHGTWIAERVGEPTIVFGEGASDDPYNPDNVVYIQGFDSLGQEIDIPLNKHEKNISFGEGAEYGSVAYVMDNGYWTEQADGEWVNKPKNEVENAKRGGHYIKTAFSVMEEGQMPDLNLLKEVPLLIAPDSDVQHSKAGDKVDITVYFNGEPLANAKVENDFVNAEGEVVAETDKNGKASVEVRNKGLNVFAVHHSIDAPADEQDKGEKIGYTATLSFVNEHADH